MEEFVRSKLLVICLLLSLLFPLQIDLHNCCVTHTRLRDAQNEEMDTFTSLESPHFGPFLLGFWDSCPEPTSSSQKYYSPSSLLSTCLCLP